MVYIKDTFYSPFEGEYHLQQVSQTSLKIDVDPSYSYLNSLKNRNRTSMVQMLSITLRISYMVLLTVFCFVFLTRFFQGMLIKIVFFLLFKTICSEEVQILYSSELIKLNQHCFSKTNLSPGNNIPSKLKLEKFLFFYNICLVNVRIKQTMLIKRDPIKQVLQFYDQNMLHLDQKNESVRGKELPKSPQNQTPYCT